VLGAVDDQRDVGEVGGLHRTGVPRTGLMKRRCREVAGMDARRRRTGAVCSTQGLTYPEITYDRQLDATSPQPAAAYDGTP
jgi:hypothetical protein